MLLKKIISSVWLLLLDIYVKQAKESAYDIMLIAAYPYESTIKFLKSYGFLYTQNKLSIPESMCFPKFVFRRHLVVVLSNQKQIALTLNVPAAVNALEGLTVTERSSESGPPRKSGGTGSR